MNGKIVCGRNLVVHFAEEKVVYKSDAPVEELLKSAAGQASIGEGGSSSASSMPASSSAAVVSALRAKLAQMERE
jgi:hypothetical protein